MEGWLIFGYYYVEVCDDFFDFEEKIEVLEFDLVCVCEIVVNVNCYIGMFMKVKNEWLVLFFVLQKYFEVIGQLLFLVFIEGFFSVIEVEFCMLFIV